MLSTQKTLSWAQTSLPRVSSREALSIYPFLDHIAWVGTKVYPPLHINEALQNTIIYLVLFFLNPHQYFIETYHGFNQNLSDLLSSSIGFCLSVFLLCVFSYDIFIMFIRVLNINHGHHFLLETLSPAATVIILSIASHVHHRDVYQTYQECM